MFGRSALTRWTARGIGARWCSYQGRGRFSGWIRSRKTGQRRMVAKNNRKLWIGQGEGFQRVQGKKMCEGGQTRKEAWGNALREQRGGRGRQRMEISREDKGRGKEGREQIGIMKARDV